MPAIRTLHTYRAYQTTILYRYNDKKIKLLKNDKTHITEKL